MLTAAHFADPAFQKKPEEEKPENEEEKPEKVVGNSADEPDFVNINRAPTLTLWVCSCSSVDAIYYPVLSACWNTTQRLLCRFKKLQRDRDTARRVDLALEKPLLVSRPRARVAGALLDSWLDAPEGMKELG